MTTRTARTVGEQIEALLAGLPPGRNRDTAEELVRLVVGLYGDGLDVVASRLRDRDPALLAELAADPLVGSLLLVHDLHPVDVDSRIQQALDQVRPYLGSHAGGVDYLGVDEAGVARLRLEGSCHGCPSSATTVTMAIETAIRDAAPELTGVEVAGMTDPEPLPLPLLQVGMHPPADWVAAEPVRQGGSAGSWQTLPELGPPTGRPVIVPVAGTRVLVCSVRGTLYAYRDECAACHGDLAESTVDDSVLACARCGARFDVRRAGRSADGGAVHLEPVPLLSDSAGTRVAVPVAVPS